VADSEPGDAQDLYGLRPAEFTAARDALARRLRAGKDREQADQVKRLRRPSANAWALNQVARADAGLIETLLDAGHEVKEALGRGDGEAMRRAERAMRKAADGIVDAAIHALGDSSGGSSGEARSRLAATLRAALIDPEVANRVRSGTLEREVELAGLGLDEVATAESRGAPPSGPQPASDDPAQRQQEDEDRKARRRRDEERRAALDRLAEQEAEAERLASRARRLADVAEQAEKAARQARAEADASAAQATDAAALASAARAELSADQ